MDYLEYMQSRCQNHLVVTRARELFDESNTSAGAHVTLPDVRKITISGLYPFKQEENVVLENQGKANIIYGGNGAGKTTTINCIEFGLLGSASALELKTTFAKRIVKKFEVRATLEIGGKSYHLYRSMTPSSDSHHSSIQRVGEEELTTDYLSTEGVQLVSAEFQRLTGMTFSEYAQVFDLLTLRVPRTHYLSSSILGTPGSLYRQRLFSKLLGHPIPVQVANHAYKKWNQAKSQVQGAKKRIAILEPLQQTPEEGPTKPDTGRETIEQQINELNAKLASLEQEKVELFDKLQTLQEKNSSVDPAIQEELAERLAKHQRLSQLEREEWLCGFCGSDYSQQARERIRAGSCPSCGQYADLSGEHEEYQANRERIHKIRRYMDKVQERQEMVRERYSQLLKEIQALDREITHVKDKKLQLTREHTVVTSGRHHEILDDARADLDGALEEQGLYEELYFRTKDWLDNATKSFVAKLNKRWAYLQRELFDVSKWALASDYEVTAEDGQEFKDLSHGEKNLTDMIFRMAVVDVLSEEQPDLNLFFIVDTPEEGLDAAFHQRLSPVLNDFVRNNARKRFIALTSCERDFVDNLSPEIFKLENLLEKSANSRPFQVKQLSLLKFLGQT